MTIRFLPLPFPACPGCNNSWKTSFHRNCGGEIEVEPITRAVRCGSCDNRWIVYDSTFYCSCGNVFSAQEVHKAIDELMSMCLRLIDIIEESEAADKLRKTRAESSLRIFTSELVRGLGAAAGFAIEKLLTFFFR
ncbi:hypothetical protein ABFW14_12200 [Mycolicibacterium fortuitum]|uniref:hypothetical protein n=1 Tax=Mycolicibacterium fortuitum TaxID=1766 RepID=UPI0034CE2F89